MTNFLSLARRFEAMLMGPPPRRNSSSIERPRFGGRAGAGSFRTEGRTKTRLVVRTILALLPVALILAGCARSLEHGTAGGGAEFNSVAGCGEIQTSLDARFYETARDWRLETEPSEFDSVVTSACGAGDVFGCGLLFARRTLLELLRFCERLDTLVLIALCLPWLIGTSLRKAIERRVGKAKDVARNSFIGSMPGRAPRKARQTDRRFP